MAEPSIAEQLLELRREARQRERVYPRFVQDGRLSQANANLQMARLRGAIATLEAVQAGTPPPPDPPPEPPKQRGLF
jgi:hypothetical protein